MKYLEAAERAYDQREWVAAEKSYRELLVLVPQDPYAYFRLGNVLAKQLRLDDAAAAYQEALVRDASFAKAYNNLGMVRLLQAEAAFVASVAKSPRPDTASVQSSKMLKEIQRITKIPVQEAESPAKLRTGTRAKGR